MVSKQAGDADETRRARIAEGDLDIGGRADGLLVAKLDRLSRSVQDFASLLNRFAKHGWLLLALDLDVELEACELVAEIAQARPGE